MTDTRLRVVTDFSFRQLKPLKIFNDNIDNGVHHDKTVHKLTVSSRHGLVFMVNQLELTVVSTEDVVIQGSKADMRTPSTDFPHLKIPLPSVSHHIHINVDESKLAIVVQKDTCPHLLICDVISMIKNHTLSVIHEARLSANMNTELMELRWNPTMGDVVAACLSDGTTKVLEIKENSINHYSTPESAGIRCMSWSPKGKQIVLGKWDGTLSQHKPDLKEVKHLPSPTRRVFQNPVYVVSVHWISNFLFLVSYQDVTDSEAMPHMVMVTTSKTGDILFDDFEDVFYCSSIQRPLQIYMIAIPEWNVIICSSSNSVDTAILGTSGKDKSDYKLYILDDNCRASLPLINLTRETFPLGMGLDFSGQQRIPHGENVTLPPMPILYLLSTVGVLIPFYVINQQAGSAELCKAPVKIHNFASNDDTPTLDGMLQTVISNNSKQPVEPISAAPFSSVFVNKASPQPPPATMFKKPEPSPISTTKHSLFGGGQQTPQQPNTGVTVKPFSWMNPATSSSPSSVEKVMKLPAWIKSSQGENSSQAVNITSPKLPPDLVPGSTTSGTVITSTPIKPTMKQTEGSAIPTRAVPTSVVNTRPIEPVEPVARDCDSNDYLIAMMEEINNFQQELEEFKGRMNKDNTIHIGTDEEKVQMIQGTHQMDLFSTEIKDITKGHSQEMEGLKTHLIEGYKWYEEAKSYTVRDCDNRYRHLLKSRPLDPLSFKQLRSIRHHLHYLDQQTILVNQLLNEEWEKCTRSYKSSEKLNLPTMESLYRILLSHRNIIAQQEQRVNHVGTRVKKVGYDDSLNYNSSTDIDLAQLADSLIQVRDGNTTGEKSSPIAMYKKVTTEKQVALKTFLGQRTVTKVSSTRPPISESKFIIHELNKLTPKSPVKTVQKTVPPLVKPIQPILTPVRKNSAGSATASRTVAKKTITGVLKLPVSTSVETKASASKSLQFTSRLITTADTLPKITPIKHGNQKTRLSFSAGDNDDMFKSEESYEELPLSETKEIIIDLSSKIKPLDGLTFIPVKTDDPAATPLTSLTALVSKYPVTTSPNTESHLTTASSSNFTFPLPIKSETPTDPKSTLFKFLTPTKPVATKATPFIFSLGNTPTTSALNTNAGTTFSINTPFSIPSKPVDLPNPSTVAATVAKLSPECVVTVIDKPAVKPDPSPSLFAPFSTTVKTGTSTPTTKSLFSTSITPITTVPSPQTDSPSTTVPSTFDELPGVLTVSLATVASPTEGSVSVTTPSEATITPVNSPVQSDVVAYERTPPSTDPLVTSTASPSPIKSNPVTTIASISPFTSPVISTEPTTSSSGMSIFAQAATNFVQQPSIFATPKEPFSFSVTTTEEPTPTTTGGTFTFSLPTTTTTLSSTTPLFGSTSFDQPKPQGSSIFGGSAVFSGGPVAGGESKQVFGQSAFGQPATFGAPNTTSIFGGSAPAFGSTASSVFGQATTAATTNVFGQPDNTTSNNNVFGGSSSNEGFFGGLGGKPSAENANKNVFGGGAVFGGSKENSESLFGFSSPHQNSGNNMQSGGPFSTGNSTVQETGFGGFGVPVKSPEPGFGSPSFGGSPGGGGFGGPATFGGSPTFGGGAVFGGSPQPNFGGGAVFGANTSGPIGGFGTFGQSTNVGFGSANNSNATFGALAQQGTNQPTFGSVLTETPTFGNIPAFGQQSNTGFGVGPSVFGGGSNTSFGSPPSGGSSFGSGSSFTSWR